MELKTANIIGCIFFLLIGIWFLVNSLLLSGVQNTADIGPAAFPILSAVGIIAASSAYILKIWFKKEKEERIQIRNKNKVYLSMTVLILYVLAMQWTGYYISSFIFIPLLLFIVGVKGLMKIIPVSIGFFVFVYVAFDILLQIPLP